MNIVIVGYLTFPTGSASGARMRNFALGFRECGAQVYVLAMAPMLQDPDNPRHTPLNYEGITYERTAWFDLSASRGAVSRLRWFLGLYGSVWTTQRRLRNIIQNGQCDFLLSYGRNAVLQWPLVQLCRKHGIPTVLDVTELAEHFRGWGGRLSPLYWDLQLGTRSMPRAFDIVSTITYSLKARYETLGCKQVFVIPSIEGWDNLPPVDPLPSHDHFRLVYVGTLTDRDAPEILLDAMRILQARSAPVCLDVIGRYQHFVEGRNRAARIQADPELRSGVNLVGEVSDEELAKRLRQADGLVLLRRDAPTEIAAFPTRLAEYLRQGRPVFVSDVGDIRVYLQHGQDALLLSPNDPEQVADVIQAVAASPDRGYRLGVQGRIRGAECFNRKFHAQRLLDLVKS